MNNYNLQPIDSRNIGCLRYLTSPIYLEAVNGYCIVMGRNLLENYRLYLVHTSILSDNTIKEVFYGIMANQAILKVIGHHQDNLKDNLEMKNVIKCFISGVERPAANLPVQTSLASAVRNIQKLQASYVGYYALPEQKEIVSTYLTKYLARMNEFLAGKQGVNIDECERAMWNHADKIPFKMIVYHLYKEGMLKVDGQLISLP